MKRLGLLVLTMVVAIVFSTNALAQDVKCQVQQTVGDQVNRIHFSMSCVNISTGYKTFYFGDETYVDLWMEAGQVVQTTHDYAYVPNGIISYNSQLAFWEGNDGYSFAYVVTIDDRPATPTPTNTATPTPTNTATPTPTNTATPTPTPEPYFDFTYEISQSPNGVIFEGSSHGYPDGYYGLNFGDGSSVQVNVENGKFRTGHAYPYKVGGLTTYTAVLFGTYELKVVIDDRQQKAVEIFLPRILKMD